MTTLVIWQLQFFFTSSLMMDHQNGKHLNNQDIDFRVAIFGLLVNLFEKNSKNRSQLAAANICVAASNEMGETQLQPTKDVVPMLCSFFLANQGAGEAAEEKNK